MSKKPKNKKPPLLKVYVFPENEKAYTFFAKDKHEKLGLANFHERARRLKAKTLYGGITEKGTICCFAKDWIEAKRIKNFILFSREIMLNGGQLPTRTVEKFLEKIK